MKKPIRLSPVAFVFMAIACLLLILFGLHFYALEEAQDYSQQRALSLETILIGSFILMLLVILFFARIRLNRQNKKWTDELYISQDWLSKTLLSTTEAVITTDKACKITFMNKGAETLTGWATLDAKDKQIDSIFDAIDEHTHIPVENPIKKALKENKVILLSNHTVLIKKDKTQLIIVDSAAPIHNDKGEIIGGVLVFRDITQQSLSRKKLLESEGLLKGIMDHTSSLIYIKDLEGKFLMINKQKEKILNLKASELIGTDSLNHLPKEQAAEVRKTDHIVIEQKHAIEFEQVIKHADGTSHTYHTSKFPLFNADDNVFAVCAVATDISESKKNIEMQEKIAAQNIILQSEVRYDEVMENMPNLFFSFDRSLRFISINKACEKFIGKKAEHVVGKTIEEAYPQNMYLSEYQQVLKTG
ncbi:MAG TPA: PAS domain S-box protein, partial [Chitinophagales bacterium]|nr:PAS domain S-box protein [Chitinophagales bacterium]